MKRPLLQREAAAASAKASASQLASRSVVNESSMNQDLSKKRQRTSDEMEVDMRPTKAARTTAAITIADDDATTLTSNAPFPAPKFQTGDHALVLNSASNIDAPNIRIEINKQRYEKDEQRWMYYGITDYFQDTHNIIGVSEDCLLKQKYEVGDIYVRMMEGLGNVCGVVKSVAARNSAFEYAVDLETVVFTEGVGER